MLKSNKERVWDLPQRLLHWSLAGSAIAAWVTSSWRGSFHEIAGYVVVAVVLARLVWGFTGSRRARFAGFVHAPAPTLRYLRGVADGSAPRYLGHNPLGGWMVVALLFCAVLVLLTGWSATTDLLWGYAWPVDLHVALAWTGVGLVALHIGGVVFTSWQHRENLVAAMFSGDKQAARPGDADR